MTFLGQKYRDEYEVGLAQVEAENLAELNSCGWNWQGEQATGWRSGNHHEGDHGWEFFIEYGTGDRITWSA